MVGFCSYGSPSGAGATANHGDDKSGSLVWSNLYDPVYDGKAYQHGVRSGDVVRAIEICETIETSSDTLADVEIEALGDSKGIETHRYRRRLVPVRNMSDAEWERHARSCEGIITSGGQGANTVIVVERLEEESS